MNSIQIHPLQMGYYVVVLVETEIVEMFYRAFSLFVADLPGQGRSHNLMISLGALD